MISSNGHKEISKETSELLVKRAVEARENAYAPYSKFKVGAAILTQEGKIYTGCNIENAVYRLGVCAEQVAIANAHQNGTKPEDLIIVAIATVADTEGPCPPCGACRQTLLEFNKEMSVIMANLNGAREVMTVSQLLPSSFSNDIAKLI